MIMSGRRAFLFLIPLFAVLCIGCVSRSVADDDAFAAQRALFVQTRAQLQDGQDDAAQNALAALKNYPLYPYLQLQQLSAAFAHNNGIDENSARVDEFLSQQDGTVAADQLRDRWLDTLATNGRWPQYLKVYRAAAADREQQCWFIEALQQTDQRERALRETDKLWLTTDMPDACDAAFTRWLASDHRSETRVWQRLQLALERNQETLARFLSVQIREPYKLQAEYALLLLRDPAALNTLLPQITQQPEASATIALALKNLARRDLDKAQTLWQQTRAAQQLSASDSDSVRRAIGRQQIAQNGAAALPWLLQYDPDGSDNYLLEWRIRLALGGGDWTNIADWIAQLPPDVAQTSCWNYWRARALQQRADPALQKQANTIFASLAKERSYYGFLAADLRKAAYPLNDEPIATDIHIADIERQPAVMRAREFFLLGETVNARREWQFAVRAMPNGERRAAALLAERWGWYDQSIRGANLSGGYNDLRLRFPIGFHDSMKLAAQKTDLPLQWLFAITRQESAFMPDARSRVGALGLMQLMPATAKLVARGEHMRIDDNQLLQPAINIRLGSAYLRELAQRYNGNRVLATAAYNAGPSRINSILREQPNTMSTDVWIELLPYRETRDYVQSVLAFSVIYAQRLGRPAPLLNKSEREIAAQNFQIGSAE